MISLTWTKTWRPIRTTPLRPKNPNESLAESMLSADPMAISAKNDNRTAHNMVPERRHKIRSWKNIPLPLNHVCVYVFEIPLHTSPHFEFHLNFGLYHSPQIPACHHGCYRYLPVYNSILSRRGNELMSFQRVNHAIQTSREPLQAIHLSNPAQIMHAQPQVDSSSRKQPGSLDGHGNEVIPSGRAVTCNDFFV